MKANNDGRNDAFNKPEICPGRRLTTMPSGSSRHCGNFEDIHDRYRKKERSGQRDCPVEEGRSYSGYTSGCLTINVERSIEDTCRCGRISCFRKHRVTIGTKSRGKALKFTSFAAALHHDMCLKMVLTLVSARLWKDILGCARPVNS